MKQVSASLGFITTATPDSVEEALGFLLALGVFVRLGDTYYPNFDQKICPVDLTGPSI